MTNALVDGQRIPLTRSAGSCNRTQSARDRRRSAGRGALQWVLRHSFERIRRRRNDSHGFSHRATSEFCSLASRQADVPYVLHDGENRVRLSQLTV